MSFLYAYNDQCIVQVPQGKALNIQTKTQRKWLDVYQCSQVLFAWEGTMLWSNHLKLTGRWWWNSACIFWVSYDSCLELMAGKPHSDS